MAVQKPVMSAYGTEEVPCHICSSSRYAAYLQARGFTVVECRDCGLRYVNPQPSIQGLEQIYAIFDQGDQWRSGEEHFNRRVRKEILRFKKTGSVIDIGSGSGNFLRCMREAGFSVFGVEPSRTGSEHARSVYGIETFNGTVETFVSPEVRREFDVVTILNVLEHLKRPGETLVELGRLLREDGILVVVVPDARLHAVLGQTRRWLGFSDPFWMERERHPLVGFDPPHHLCSFEPRTILLLLERCGFRGVCVRNAPEIFNQDRWKNVAKVIVRSFSEVLYRLSFRQLLFGYSTLVVARKR